MPMFWPRSTWLACADERCGRPGADGDVGTLPTNGAGDGLQIAGRLSGGGPASSKLAAFLRGPAGARPPGRAVRVRDQVIFSEQSLGADRHASRSDPEWS